MRLIRQNLHLLAVDSACVRDMDRRAIHEYGLAGMALMESAGAAAAALAAEMCPPGRPVTVLAGSGNNAGDGFVIARHLANRGRRVDIVTAVPPPAYAGDAAANCRIALAMRLPLATWPQMSPAAGRLLIVDALLGTGLSGDLRPPYPALIDFINAPGVPVLSVDVPSGLDADTGRIHGAAVKASKTITFVLPKIGLFIGDGPALAGEVILADIGIPADLYPPGKALSNLCE